MFSTIITTECYVCRETMSTPTEERVEESSRWKFKGGKSTMYITVALFVLFILFIALTCNFGVKKGENLNKSFCYKNVTSVTQIPF
jgi:hypothetical protein